MNNIKFSASSLRPVDLLALTTHVITNMTNNPYFPTPLVDLAALQAKADEVRDAIDLGKEGSKIQRTHRDVVVKELGNMMRRQASYVRTVCDGDLTKLVSCGFELAKKAEPVGIPDAPLIKSIEMTGITGQVEIKWGKVRGTQVYQIWMTETDPAVKPQWKLVNATSRIRTKVDGMNSYKTYWFAVSAIGSAGNGAKSDPALGVAS